MKGKLKLFICKNCVLWKRDWHTDSLASIILVWTTILIVVVHTNIIDASLTSRINRVNWLALDRPQITRGFSIVDIIVVNFSALNQSLDGMLPSTHGECNGGGGIHVYNLTATLPYKQINNKATCLCPIDVQYIFILAL